MHQGLFLQDRLRRVAHRLHRHVRVEEADDTARTAFQALVAPREGANDASLPEHQFDVAAEIFGMQQALLERPVVERKYIGRNLSAGFLVRVMEGTEEFARRLAVFFGELLGDRKSTRLNSS